MSHPIRAQCHIVLWHKIFHSHPSNYLLPQTQGLRSSQDPNANNTHGISYHIPKQIEINESTYLYNMSITSSTQHKSHHVPLIAQRHLSQGFNHKITFHTFTLIMCSEQHISSTTQHLTLTPFITHHPITSHNNHYTCVIQQIH